MFRASTCLLKGAAKGLRNFQNSCLPLDREYDGSSCFAKGFRYLPERKTADFIDSQNLIARLQSSLCCWRTGEYTVDRYDLILRSRRYRCQRVTSGISGTAISNRNGRQGNTRVASITGWTGAGL